MDVRNIFRKRAVWSIALYQLKSKNEIFELYKHVPFKYIGESGIRQDKKYQAITADPFLFVHNERLYLFYEIQTDFGQGEIWAKSMNAQGVWECYGRVLKEDFHLSYPQVFRYDNQVYMIPEAAQSGKVWLYTSLNFPFLWKRVRSLIDEPLLDPSIVIRPEGLFLFGTTRNYELKLYYSGNITKKFISISEMITNDKAIARNAGRPIIIDEVLYRLAQNCKYEYGENISLLQINKLSTEEYSENTIITDLYENKPKWMELGYHHLSTAFYNGGYYVAVDGMRKDKYINKLILAVYKIKELVITQLETPINNNKIVDQSRHCCNISVHEQIDAINRS